MSSTVSIIAVLESRARSRHTSGARRGALGRGCPASRGGRLDQARKPAALERLKVRGAFNAALRIAERGERPLARHRVGRQPWPGAGRRAASPACPASSSAGGRSACQAGCHHAAGARPKRPIRTTTRRGRREGLRRVYRGCFISAYTHPDVHRRRRHGGLEMIEASRGGRGRRADGRRRPDQRHRRELAQMAPAAGWSVSKRPPAKPSARPAGTAGSRNPSSADHRRRCWAATWSPAAVTFDYVERPSTTSSRSTKRRSSRRR